MSIFDKIGKWIGDEFGGAYHAITGTQNAAQKREAANATGDTNRMLNEQIKAYRDQTELTKNQINAAKDAQQVEQRRIQEKQIRSLRRNYRAQGLLGVGGPVAQDTSNKLGG